MVDRQTAPVTHMVILDGWLLVKSNIWIVVLDEKIIRYDRLDVLVDVLIAGSRLSSLLSFAWLTGSVYVLLTRPACCRIDGIL